MPLPNEFAKTITYTNVRQMSIWAIIEMSSFNIDILEVWQKLVRIVFQYDRKFVGNVQVLNAMTLVTFLVLTADFNSFSSTATPFL